MPNLLPPSATALSRTLDQLAEQRLDQPLPHRHSWNPWHCRADLLGPLAWGLGVDNWDNLMTEQARRQACADAIKIHRLRGTVDSVERAIRSAGHEDITLEEGLPPVTRNGQQLRNGHELYGSGGRWAMYRQCQHRRPRHHQRRRQQPPARRILRKKPPPPAANWSACALAMTPAIVSPP